MPSTQSKAQETSDAGPPSLAPRPGSNSTPAPTTAPRYNATPCGTEIVRRNSLAIRAISLKSGSLTYSGYELRATQAQQRVA